ncbi:unnamed protein product, partial [Iphiclides podalirius]
MSEGGERPWSKKVTCTAQQVAPWALGAFGVGKKTIAFHIRILRFPLPRAFVPTRGGTSEHLAPRAFMNGASSSRLTQMSRRPDEPENSLFFLNCRHKPPKQNKP